MDCSINFHKLQTKKTTKPRKHHPQLRKIANMLRYAELCVVLVLVSRLSINLPYTTECFRNFMGSPRFVFLLGNVIIITLFAQSGQFSSNHSSSAKHAPPEPADLYLEFLQNTTIHQKLQLHLSNNNRKPKPSVRLVAETVIIKGQEIDATKTAETSLEMNKKDYRRCQSDIIVKRVETEKLPPRVLQRCETQKVQVNNNNSYPEDGMSNDDFRRKVEAFIARQQRLRTTQLSN